MKKNTVKRKGGQLRRYVLKGGKVKKEFFNIGPPSPGAVQPVQRIPPMRKVKKP